VFLIFSFSPSCIIDGILSLQSDDESEELEEGEWRPEEEEKENYVFADIDEVEEGEIREDPAHEGSSPTNEEDYQHGAGEVVGTSYLHPTEGSVDMAGNGTDLSVSDMAAEEQWQAQYLQTAKPRVRSYVGSMDLWDWSIIEQEKKVGKKKVKKLFRLIGRLAPNATQVHPSLRGSGGLIRTTPICEADHEFVKVSSGSFKSLVPCFIIVIPLSYIYCTMPINVSSTKPCHIVN
jgi:hypothetical protein